MEVETRVREMRREEKIDWNCILMRMRAEKGF